jgi:hypothetical protein
VFFERHAWSAQALKRIKKQKKDGNYSGKLTASFEPTLGLAILLLGVLGQHRVILHHVISQGGVSSHRSFTAFFTFVLIQIPSCSRFLLTRFSLDGAERLLFIDHKR